MGLISKSRRGLSRTLWRLLGRLPESIQAWIVRRKVHIPFGIQEDLVFKVAESEDEIKQALSILYESYVELKYIDQNQSRVRFTEFHALPSTIILVAKLKDEVIGTLSIIQDSPLGLPIDMTWSLDKYREQGLLLAEVSSLTIKKNFRSKRGEILLPLCKLMFMVSRKILRVDGFVIAVSKEVQLFYSKVLLFETISETRESENHSFVKGNPSYCGFLSIGDDFVIRYFTAYSKRPKKYNLYHYFLYYDEPQIRLPQVAHSIHPIEQKLNLAKAALLQNHSDLIHVLKPNHISIIKNLDSESTMAIVETLPQLEGHNTWLNTWRRSFRYRVRQNVTLSSQEGLLIDQRPALNSEAPTIKLIPTELLEVSETGVLLRVRKHHNLSAFPHGSKLTLSIPRDKIKLILTVEVRWSKWSKMYGCSLVNTDSTWLEYITSIQNEIRNAA